MLRLDAAGLFQEKIGAQGIRRSAWPREIVRASVHLARIQEERARGLHAYLDLPADGAARGAIRAFARATRRRFDAVCVLGIGGSALGTTAVASALRPAFARLSPRLTVLDNIDPEWLARFAASAEVRKTLFCVVSKSGGTPETAAQFLWVRDLLARRIGPGFRRNLVVVTDPAKGPLRRLAQAEKLASFPIPPAVGGRFSVLSPACLAPLAFAGIDIDGLAKGAAAMERLCRRPGPNNPAVALAAALHHFYRRGRRIVVMMPYAQQLASLADWYAQLLGESLGKRVDAKGRVVHAGLTPVRALGATDQHSQVQLYVEGPHDKVVLFLAVGRFPRTLKIPRTDVPEFSYLSGKTFNALYEAERRGTAQSLAESNRPAAEIVFPRVTPEAVGAFLLLMELKVALLGRLMGIDPYDQPGVERGKVVAREILSRPRKSLTLF